MVAFLPQQVGRDQFRPHVRRVQPVDEELEHRLDEVAIKPVIKDAAEKGIFASNVIDQALLYDSLVVAAARQHHINICKVVLVLESKRSAIEAHDRQQELCEARAPPLLLLVEAL